MEKKKQGENNSCESKTRIWEPTGKGNVEIDLTVARYHEWLDRILEDNANARDRQPFNTWEGAVVVGYIYTRISQAGV